MTDKVVQVAKTIVRIEYYQSISFDTNDANAGEATGFIVDVDDEEGLILTNRHIVGTGLFRGRCVFHNYEECDVSPVYTDPIHDFSLLKFDPKKIKHMKLSALQMKPELAYIGQRVQVIGNDNGVLSVLSGIISRLDCNVPEDDDDYRDFNINYLQAAVDASGGSSGSPVVNEDGYAVAMQAVVSTEAATSYFLPLDRPLWALEYVKQGKRVPRGDIQVEWTSKSFHECRKLHLSGTWEETLRSEFPKENRMLVAKSVIPTGAADSRIIEGDILIGINGKHLTRFVDLDATLDDNVGRDISILLLRGGKECTIEVRVSNLHDLIPNRFVSVAGGTFHDVSLQHALVYSIPCNNAGVLVSQTNGSFGYHWLIEKMDGKETPNLEEFCKVVETLRDRSRIIVKFKYLEDPNSVYTQIVDFDGHWYPKMKLATRNDETGRWDFTARAKILPAIPPKPQKANLTSSVSDGYRQAEDVVRSFVQVTALAKLQLDGRHSYKFKGDGLVVSAKCGLVICSRHTVPHTLCDITLTVGKSIFVEAKIVYMDQNCGFVLLRYEPSLVLANVHTAPLSDGYFKIGDEAIYLGITDQGDPSFAKTSIANILTWSMPKTTHEPQYRVTNIDMIVTETSLPRSGVLMTRDGSIQALCFTFTGSSKNTIGSIATPILKPVIEMAKQVVPPKVNALNFEIIDIEITKARLMGVSERRIKEIENKGRHRLLQVGKIIAGRDETFEEFDIILTLNGQLVTDAWKLDILKYSNSTNALVVRNGRETNVTLRQAPTDDLETNHVVRFGGATIQPPHYAVRQQVRKLHSMVYISYVSYGSPAQSYDLCATWFVTHINSIRTPDLPSFLNEVRQVREGDHLKFDCITLDGMHRFCTLKKDEYYFPTIEYKKNPMKPRGWDVINWTNTET
ncbi:Pro-apoptotic serine protease NMA111 [Zopfia rhizophila CBS 207.26]|uniref:Pro-apoptotic serine protease NMA111 n=1 Tax=Zopfia rhizophila CBS 207.26 TaxID=1314779 RepID=A0A6A6DD09_9PEZI|nr:Pro-apoptotic serine protease NMA111 [Zopfia rhizophila CBS 207.26]